MFDLKTVTDAHRGQSLELASKHINPAFTKVLKILGFDIQYTRGQGAYLYDDKDQRYIDCLAGYGTFACGRNHPVIRQAIKDAMDMDLPNLIKMGQYNFSGLLAQELLKLAPGDLDTVFFTSSGAEGVETALKYARAATGRSKVLFASHAFHGLSLGSLSINGNDEFRQGFEPLLPNCQQIPFDDLAALEQALAGKDVAAFIVEPIQGKGVNIPSDDYLPNVQRLCKQYGALFIADEVQTGLGRTGKMFACEHWNVEPDIMIIAKALSGGYVPCGAVLSKRWIHEKVFSSLDRCVVHSTTFGQNDLAMVAGLATLATLRDEKIVENAAAVGQLLKDKLTALIPKYELLHGVRGKGLMIAIEFGSPRSMGLKMGWTLLHKVDQSLFCQAVLIPLLTDHHVLAQVAGHHMDVIKLIPPLVLSTSDVDDLVTAFDQVIAACHRFPGPVWEVGKRLSSHAMKRKTTTAPA